MASRYIDAQLPMETLNLPHSSVRTRLHRGRTEVFDPFRDRYVSLTPEEWVRQQFAAFLVHARGVPRGLIAIESGFRLSGRARRADIVVHAPSGPPVFLVECKAPTVALGTRTFEQVARYNTVVGARLVIVTNGVDHYCYRTAREALQFLDEIPPFSDVLEERSPTT